MKTLNSKNNSYLFMTIVILIGFCSCDKEQYEEPKSAKINVENVQGKGGDDEEEAIIQGIVQDDEGLPIVSTQVEIFRTNTTTPLFTKNTDVNGEFQLTVPNGSYYFEVTENSSIFTTDSVQLSGNSTVVITIE